MSSSNPFDKDYQPSKYATGSSECSRSSAFVLFCNPRMRMSGFSHAKIYFFNMSVQLQAAGVVVVLFILKRPMIEDHINYFLSDLSLKRIWLDFDRLFWKLICLLSAVKSFQRAAPADEEDFYEKEIEK